MRKIFITLVLHKNYKNKTETKQTNLFTANKSVVVTTDHLQLEGTIST